MPLSLEDQKRLTAAEGYLELQMFQDADSELDRLALPVREVPEALVVRLGVCQGLKQWGPMQVVARQLLEIYPDSAGCLVSLAYATRRAESIEAARPILVDALNRHPMEAIIHYNLACYDCQLGDLHSANDFLRHAFELSENCRQMALEDPDLTPLHPLI